MGDWKFHCDVLSLPPTASGNEIKAAFRKLALRFHPDRNAGSPESKAHFQRINISYRYLMRNLAHRPPAPDEPARPHPPRHRAPPPRGWRWPKRNQLISAGAAAFAIALAMLIPHAPSRTPASAEPAPAANIDDFGRPKDSCEFLALERGNPKDSAKQAHSEWDCDLLCNRWVSLHEDFDDTCSWKGTEFRRHAARENRVAPKAKPPYQPVAALPKQAGLRDDGLYDDHSPNARAELAIDEEPDGVGVIPTQHVTAQLGVHNVVTAAVSPRVYVSDSKILRVEATSNRLQFVVTPIRAGEATLVVTDKIGQPISRYFYTVP